MSRLSGLTRLISPVRQNSSNTGLSSLRVNAPPTPAGRQLYAMMLQLHTKLTAAGGPGTANLSAVIKDITITDEHGNNVGYILGQALDMACFESEFQERWAPDGRLAGFVTDPVVAATATDYNGTYTVLSRFKGEQFNVLINLNPLSSFAGLTVSSGVVDGNIVFYYEDVAHRSTVPETLLATQLFNNTKFVVEDAHIQQTDVKSLALMLDNTEISGATSGLQLGADTFNPEQISDLEYDFAQNGTQVNQTNPLTTNPLYALFTVARIAGPANYSTLSAQSPIFIARFRTGS